MLSAAMEIQDELVRVRRDLHAHPELSFEETRTAGVVADTLRGLGFEQVRTGVGRTGVVADIGPADLPMIGLRADMDALPIREATGLPYASTVDGVMHACGHDCHTSMLLGAARLIKDEYDRSGSTWQGRVRLLFQPSEEAADADGISGATAMINDSALEGVSEVVALHILSDLESGVLQFSDGYSMAAVDTFEATVRGEGGHGAYPHLGSDPLFMLSTVLPNLYAIPSRHISPLQQCVVSLGAIQGGTTSNVIPASVRLQGTIRAFDETVREQLWAEVENCFRITEGLGGSYEFHLQRGYPPLRNDANVNARLRNIAADFVPANAIRNEPFGMGAEDFAYMAQAAPGAMFLLGAHVDQGGSHHMPNFMIDESVLPLGTAMLAEAARGFVAG